MDRYDVAIVGAGIAGVSLAWHLMRRGKRVIVLERSAKAAGASVRNFGMVWVVGQPQGEIHDLALRSRELWLQAADELGFWIRPCGSLTLAYDPLEAQVLSEYAESNDGRHARHVLSPEAVHERFPFVRQDGLRLGFHSPTEAGVDPREVVHQAAETLSTSGVEFRFDANVVRVSEGCIDLADGNTVYAEKIVVCPGPNLIELLPNQVNTVGLTPSRLQMMRLAPKSGVGRLGTHLCAGLTLSHYANFRNCPSLPALKARHSEKWPLQVQHHIHVLVAEYADGTITVGDSHEYGRGGSIYHDEAVDDAILAALNEFLPVDNYDVVQRWDGVYNTHPTLPYWWDAVGPNIWALNVFGTGMTLSFGLTEQVANEITRS